ncbi:MAG: DUF459 domain-containing protein [Rhizobiales bacterium]|nr:DUF459 domain-containing protein [Hyphomicrobiales bacterium]NRB14726.1 DUF459 domain-containing protein [Hyphomicrobiales bacterium]
MNIMLKLVLILAAINIFLAATFANADESKPLKLGVAGDLMAFGLVQAIDRQLLEFKNLDLVPHSFAQGSSGFVRQDLYNWNQQLPALLAATPIDYMMVFMGANDRQALQKDGLRVAQRTSEWREEYTYRIDEFLETLAKNNVKIIWIGLPIAQSEAVAADMAMLNDIYRQRVENYRGMFFDSWSLFADENGKYVQIGADLQGQIKQLRAGNGIHFTDRGYDKLAHQILRMLSDLELSLEVNIAATDVGEVVVVEKYKLDDVDLADVLLVGRVDGTKDTSQILPPPITARKVFEVGQIEPEKPDLADIITNNINEAGNIPVWKKVLQEGYIIAPELGRSDDFSWPRN